MSLMGWDFRRSSRCSGVSVTSLSLASTEVVVRTGAASVSCFLSGVTLLNSSVEEVSFMIRIGDMEVLSSGGVLGSRVSSLGMVGCFLFLIVVGEE